MRNKTLSVTQLRDTDQKLKHKKKLFLKNRSLYRHKAIFKYVDLTLCGYSSSYKLRIHIYQKIQFFHLIYEQKKVSAIIAQPIHVKCESFHNKFNSYFESSHPNVYKFIEVLKLIQTKTVILIQSSNKSKLHERLQIRNKIIFIDTQIKKLSEKKISNFEYLQTLAKKYKPKQCYK
ncbi:hypothetical protein AGLY_010184 [Aphis glycines]|uniref:Uncharacterized protein n=1 Tax=Aphis glycines TaxID=307491 RepID=A0A6G0TFF8_APHGL|nr:hypothetical protein AGLY_010184 [Aphis glycines]